MRVKTVVFLLLNSYLWTLTKGQSYLSLRKLSKEKYQQREWEDAARYLDQAISSFAIRQSQVYNCISECTKSISTNDIYYHLTLYSSTKDCIRQSCEADLGEPLEVSFNLYNVFRNRREYQTIDMCWSFVGNYTGSFEAVQTYLLYNPSSVSMYNRLQDLYKILLVDSTPVSSVDPLFHKFYKKGVDSYDKQNWKKCIHYFERALAEFFKAVEQCLNLCTFSYDKILYSLEEKDNEDLAFDLKHASLCRHSCYRDNGYTSLSSRVPYLASFLEHLQFCYYSDDLVNLAAKCTHSYRLLDKRNPRVNENVLYFTNDLGMSESFREDIKSYVEKSEADKAIYNNYYKVSKKELSKMYKEEDSFGVDNTLTQKQCNVLMDLVDIHGIHNDGYESAKSRITSPFTKYETFRGIELRKAYSLLDDKKVSLSTYTTYYDVVVLVKELMVEILEIELELYFNYIHLIKRTFKPGDSKRPLDDLSHPIHGDNCYFDAKKRACIKDNPAFTFRDWTATLYLNKPEEGGSFIFVNEKEEITREVEVEPGRLLGFHASLLHGVKPLLSGSRYAIGIWFTHDIDKAIDMETLAPKRLKKEPVKEREEKDDTKQEL